MIRAGWTPLIALTSALAFGAHGAPARAESYPEEESAHAHVSLVQIRGGREALDGRIADGGKSVWSRVGGDVRPEGCFNIGERTLGL